MSKINKTITINSPVNKVYEFLTTPDNWTKYVTSLTEVKDVSSPDAAAGTTFRWTYRMLGMNFHGKGVVTDNIKNRKFSMKMEGSFPIHESYSFSPSGEGTELTAEIEYEMPTKILNAVSKKGIMEKINKKEADSVLNKIKLLCEGL